MNNIPKIIIGASIAFAYQASYAQNISHDIFQINTDKYKINSTSKTTGAYDFLSTQNQFENVVHKFYDNLLVNQKSLPKEILQVMNDNMDYLYEPVPF